MDHAELRAKVHDYFRAQLDRGRQRRNELGPFSVEEKESAKLALSMLEEGNHNYWHHMGSDYARAELDQFFRETGLPRDDYRDHTPTILNEIRKARIGAYKAVLDHAEALEAYDFTEPLSVPERAGGQQGSRGPRRGGHGATEGSQASHSPLLSELFEARRAEAKHGDEWSAKITEDYQVWVGLFTELAGDRPILDYQKPDAREFKAILQELPANRKKLAQTRGLGPREAAEAGKLHGLPVLDTSTVNKALGRLQAIWRWADKQLDEEVPDIFGPMKIAQRTGARNEADPFSGEQLQAIFDGPLFTGCKSTRFRAQPGNTDMSGTSWFWLPLLGLWTGARLNELCQLRVEDVEEDEGIPFLHIRAGDETQRIKGGKRRIVPIHPQLVELGFLRYVVAQLRAGEERVFPELNPGPSGYYSDRPSKDFSAYLKALRIKTDKTSFHSFRHGVKDALRSGGVHPDINDILLGHSLHGMAGRYGAGGAPLALLYEALCKIEYPGLSLERVIRP